MRPLFVTALLTLLLTACGQTGPLYLPKEEAAPAPVTTAPEPAATAEQPAPEAQPASETPPAAGAQ